jgi:DNA polymerase-3 subunit gamma/tau
VAYQVIARKYRPQRFADVVGQEHVTQTLANAITQKAHRPRLSVLRPARHGQNHHRPHLCQMPELHRRPERWISMPIPGCMEITEGRSLDVMEIDGASNNGVEQVRELRETCKLRPRLLRSSKSTSSTKFTCLTTAAFNALLKTLEEPPAHVKFMFATTDPEKVLPPFLSRCQRFDLRRISRQAHRPAPGPYRRESWRR